MNCLKKPKKKLHLLEKKLNRKKSKEKLKKYIIEQKNIIKEREKFFNPLVDKYKNKTTKNIQIENYKFRITVSDMF